jgi:hypothetical protein
VPDIGHVDRGDRMKLMEMFSAIGAPKEELKDIDWADDLKFFIDNDDRLLTQYMFPALQKHEKHAGHPDAYKLYLKPVKECCKIYIKRFEIEDPKDKFTEDILEGIAKKIAEEQEKHIKDGDYHRDAD